MKGFTTGMIFGGLVGATISMVSGSNNGRSRKKMMRAGKNMFRKSGRIISDIADMVR